MAMTGLELMREAVRDLHGVLINDLAPLSNEQLAWRPAPGHNSVGFIIWHFFRIVDDYIQHAKGQPSLWQSEQWHNRFDMSPDENGMGMASTAAPALPGGSKELLQSYVERVIANTTTYLAEMDEAIFEQAPDPAKPKRTVARIMLNFVIEHGWWHVGELRYVKGLQGMPGAR